MKSYKKWLEELNKAESLEMSELVNFAIGKGQLRLPKRDELERSFTAMDANSMAGGVSTLIFEVPDKMSWKDEKMMMDTIITRLNSTPLVKELAIEQLMKLWELAHNKRRRQYMIAAASLLAIAGTVALSKFVMDRRNDKMNNDDDDTVIAEIDIDEIDAYDNDVPEIELDDSEI